MVACNKNRAVLLAVCLLCTLLPVLSQEKSQSREATGDEGTDSAVYVNIDRNQALQHVCEHTNSAFLDQGDQNSDIYSAWGRRGLGNVSARDVFFSSKPETTSKNSLCDGINFTCCKRPAEKEIFNVAYKEYRQVYHDAMQSHFDACPTAGREFYHGIRKALTETKRQLEIKINNTVKTLPTDAFNRLFDYLVEFTISPDLCPLRPLVHSQVQNLTNLVLLKYIHFGDEPENATTSAEHLECIENITKSFTEEHTNDILLSLGRQLHHLKVFVQALHMAEEVITTIKQHAFSSTCITAIARMKHCALCAGYTKLKPCLHLCLNTMRGCVADIAELKKDFGGLVSSMRALSSYLKSDLTPEWFIGNILSRFVELVDELRSSEYDWRAQLGSECGGAQQVTVERYKRGRFFQPIRGESDQEESRTLFNINIDGDDPFSFAFEIEFECLHLLDSLLLGIPQEMCYLNGHAHTNNDKCWTGNSLGRYDAQLAGALKIDLMTNAAFSTLPLSTDILYLDLIKRMRALTMEINSTIAFKELCFDSDDEDCIRNYFASCDNKDPNDFDSSSGSTSGSGSGSGSGRGESGFDDLESTSEEPTNIWENSRYNRPDGYLDRFGDAHSPITTTKAPQLHSTTDSNAYGTIDIIDITPGKSDVDEIDIDAVGTTTGKTPVVRDNNDTTSTSTEDGDIRTNTDKGTSVAMETEVKHQTTIHEEIVDTDSNIEIFSGTIAIHAHRMTQVVCIFSLYLVLLAIAL